jgi:hypothetical protein
MILTRRRRQAPTRARASAIARQLVLELSNDAPAGPAPYTVGVVLQPSEQVWAQVPARCSADQPAGPRDKEPRHTDWLVTSLRVAGRLHPDTLRWWEWVHCIGCQVDLTPGRERVSLDFPGLPGPVHWRGPGVAPLAVASVVKLHGPRAALDHPGLAVLRSAPATVPVPDTVGDQLRGHAVGELPPGPGPLGL